jgi:uncharacterized alpha-E superfamily protein
VTSLLSRYAESVFWMARYVERAESLSRILETQSSFQRGRSGDNSWAWIVALYSDAEAFSKAFGEVNAANVIRYYMAHIDNPGSVQASIRSARENARALRPMLPTDMWYQLNDFYNRLLGFGPADYSEMRLSRTCDAIKRGCYAQIGVAENTLYHDEIWPFFRLGLFVERADQTSRLLDVRFAQQSVGALRDEGQFDFGFWTILLRAASAYHAYRRVFPRVIDPHEVARFLIFDRRLPRSIVYCIGEMQNMTEMLRRGFGLRHAGSASEQIEMILSGLNTAQRDADLLTRLHDFNDWMQTSLMAVTDELSCAFFGYSRVARPAAPALPFPHAALQSKQQSGSQPATLTI